MAIGTPDILLKLADTTGTVVVNSGSLGTNYALHGSSATRSASNGLWTGTGKIAGSDGSTNMMWLDITGATGPGTNLDSINCAIAFKKTGALDNNSAKLVMPNTSTADGNIRISLDPPTSTGDFDLNVDFRHTGGAGTTAINFPNLSNNTVYQLACALDNSGGTGAMLPRAKLNAGTAANGTSASFTSFGFENAWPRLLHRSDFQGGAFGLIGEIYYIVYERLPGASWTLTDLDSINSDPATAFGFGGGGGGAVKRNNLMLLGAGR